MPAQTAIPRRAARSMTTDLHELEEARAGDREVWAGRSSRAVNTCC